MIHEYSIHAGYLGRVAGRGAHGVIVCRYQTPPPPTHLLNDILTRRLMSL